MRTWIPIALSIFVLLTIAITILLSDSPISEPSATGMNVEVTEGVVRLSTGELSDTLHAGEIAALTADGKMSIKTGNKQITADGTKVPSTLTSQSGPIAQSTNKPQVESSTSEITSATLPVEHTTREAFYIAGYVMGENGDILKNSTIRCQHYSQGRNRWLGTIRSNENGYYIFEVPGTGEYRLTSSPSEKYLEDERSTHLSETKKTEVVNFLHKRGALAVKGRTIDRKTGEPICGANVQLYDVQGKKMYKTTSGDDGRFIMNVAEEGVFSFCADAEGYGNYDSVYRKHHGIAESLANVSITADTQSKEYTIKLDEANAVTVLVVDSNQTPVADAQVTARPYGVADQDSYQIADENGVARFTNITPGKVLFRARKEGYGESASEIVETGSLEAPTNATIVLGEPSSICGRIAFLDGSPAAEWLIFVHNMSMARRIEVQSMISTRVKTDEDGNYYVTALGKGEYKLAIFKQSENGQQRVFSDRIISLDYGEDKEGVDFTIEEGDISVSGTVISQNGTPISGAKVKGYPTGRSNPNLVFSESVCLTNENGEFTIEKMYQAKYVMVSVTAEGYRPFRYEFPMNRPIVVRMAPTESISGVVLDRATQQPISEADVILRIPFPRNLITTTDASGRFEFVDFLDGQYELFAYARGYAYSPIQKIDTKSGQTYQGIVLELENANEFNGIVVDPSGNPVLGAIVGLESRMTNRNSANEYRGLMFTETSMSAGDGSFQIANRSHQPDTLVIRHPNFATAMMPLSAEWNNDRPPAFRLSVGGAVEGVVLDAEQKPIVACPVHCIGDPNICFGGNTLTDSDGRYRIEHLPASNYRLFVRTRELMMEPAQVTEGQTTQVDFATEKQNY